ncbi:MAG: hypothetical protein HYY23_00260 [Verrucomicrobia bacterium]|nr:hypothetical protein [Verrucomicrobiota bacterium]
MKTPLKTVFRPINALLAATLGLMASTLWVSANPPRAYSNAPHNLAERGPFYRVWQRTVPVTDSLTGKFTYELQQYTELGDGLCYWRMANGSIPRISSRSHQTARRPSVASSKCTSARI